MLFDKSLNRSFKLSSIPQWRSQDFGLGGANVSISSAGDAVNHRIDEPVQRCQKTHYHQYVLPIIITFITLQPKRTLQRKLIGKFTTKSLGGAMAPVVPPPPPPPPPLATPLVYHTPFTAMFDEILVITKLDTFKDEVTR